MRGRTCLASVVLVAAMTVSWTATSFASHHRGFNTLHPPMLTPHPDTPGVAITPLITVGDTLSNGYRFESIPDGIAVDSPARRGGHRRAHRSRHGHGHGHGRVHVYVNHETGKSPFPWNVNGGNTKDNAENDFDNSQLSRLTLDTRTGGVLGGRLVITSRLGYQRFCSNYLATWREGFTRKILLTNEESPDYFLRQENSWPPLPIGHPQEKEAGLVVAYDVESGTQRPIHGMGRHNHENSVPVPGYGKPVVLSGDDTFTSGALVLPGSAPELAQSQLYSYIAKSTNDLMKDKGDLWAFVSDTPGVDDYYDVPPSSPMSITGHFVKVPRHIATGLNPDGSEIQAEDVGYPEPPNNGTWQPEPRWQQPTPAPGVDGPQWVLQHWSDINNVFQFVRVEDIAYDKRPGMGNVVYIVDSGRGRLGLAGTPETSGGVTYPFRSTNGRVWKMVLDKRNPTKVTSLSVFVEGEDKAVKMLDEIHQPDNVESTKNGILVTEDPGSNQHFAPGSTDPNATTARLWRVPFAGGDAAKRVVASVDQSQDSVPPAVGGTDVDGRLPANWGMWESSGIVDASHAFGPDMFLVDVQAHTLWVEKKEGEDNFAPTGPDFMYKREGGQLLLIKIPGG